MEPKVESAQLCQLAVAHSGAVLALRPRYEHALHRG